MKMICLILIALALTFSALAEMPVEKDRIAPTETAPDSLDSRSEMTVTNSIRLDIGGEMVELGFDDTPQYSSIDGGVVQASYYNYSPDGNTLYELYLVFPQSARAGDEITTEYAVLSGEECSVVLIISDVQTQQENYYFASVLGSSAYPENSDFLIRIDHVDSYQGTVSYSGSLSARLVALDMSTGEVSATLDIPETTFNFSINGSENEQRHTEPLPTAMPSDMRKV